MTSFVSFRSLIVPLFLIRDAAVSLLVRPRQETGSFSTLLCRSFKTWLKLLVLPFPHLDLCHHRLCHSLVPGLHHLPSGASKLFLSRRSAATTWPPFQDALVLATSLSDDLHLCSFNCVLALRVRFPQAGLARCLW